VADLTFYDAAWPPNPPPETDGCCVYIGGDAVHVWTAAEIAAQKARYRLPVFVRSGPRGIGGVASDVNAAFRGLAAIGAPRGILVAFDLETATDKLYVAGVYAGLAAQGFKLIVYGSESAVMGNDNPDDLYWAADWTGTPHLSGGAAMEQWVSFAGYDEDLARPSLPFWDTQAAPPKPPAPAVRAWTTEGIDSLAGLAQAHGISAAEILRVTAQHVPEYSPEMASWLNGVFGGQVSPAEKIPAGMVLYLPG
jgi:hypothetical protein